MAGAEQVEREVRAWLTHVVVGLNLCPFASRSMPGLQISLHNGIDAGEVVVQVVEHSEALLQAPEEAPATALMIVPTGVEDFATFLDLVALVEMALDRTGLRGKIQLATFHPDYVFEGVSTDDASNLTNRSPWPLLHLLRECDVAWAVSHHPEVEAIPERNIARVRALGRDAIEALWRRHLG